MKMCENFKNPDEEADSDSLDELIDGEDEFGIPVVVAANDSDASDAEAADDDYQVDADEYDTSDFDPNATDSDDSMIDSMIASDVEAEAIKKSNQEFKSKVKNGTSTNEENKNSGPSCSSAGTEGGVGVQPSSSDLNEDDEDDETVRAIIAAIKKPRTSPPEIKLEDFITDICFHPDQDIIAIGTISGDVYLYKYANEENTLLRTIEIHAKACRDVEFTDDGTNLLTCSKDKSIMVTDMETEKLKKFYESAHEEAINKLHVIDEHLFATGDDGGTVKLWDLRTKNAIFALKEVEDYISQILTNDAKKLLLLTSGDGHLTTINIGARKLYVQSEPYEEELTCMGTYRGDSKLVVGTSKGRLYTYNWGQFGYHCDMFPGIKTPIGEMVPITDRIGCIAGEEGIIRACHIAPFRNLGIVGQHNMPVESLDISNSGELIASSSHNNDIRFWNVKYFEDFGDIKYNEKHNTYKESRHNLPSSKFSNATDFFADLSKAPSDNE